MDRAFERAVSTPRRSYGDPAATAATMTPMQESPLANPVWETLRTRHRAMARVARDVARYPPEVAPFLAVAHAGVDAGPALDELVGDDETVYLLGVAPEPPPGWSLKAYRPLAQMVRDAPLEVVDGPDPIELSESHRADVLELTALVYPHYFRPRTMDMGRYLGIYLDGRLAAITGERMGTHDQTEISAICTHPDFLGRGLARRLIAMACNDNLARGRLPFLHVSYENPRALQLYARMGFAHRPDVGFWSLRRA